MMDNFIKIVRMEEEYIIIKMETNMMENLRERKKMEKANIIIEMEIYMKEDLEMIIRMIKE